MTHHLDLATITLKKGNHKRRSEGGCMMEWTSYMADEPWSDHPACVSSVIAAFCRRWQDDLDDATRQRLKPYVVKVIGTNTGAADDEIRAWMVTDWLVRTYMPAWLDLAGMTSQAAAVRALAPVTSGTAWEQGQPAVEAARRDACAAGAAARDAAGAAAWDAARDAAGAAAWAAAWAAAGAAAWAAAWDAAGAAARAAAWAAAGAAAWAAAWAAAGAAAGAAAWAAAWAAAGAAAWAAAWDALRPTAEGLQASAFELLDALCAVGRKAEVPA